MRQVKIKKIFDMFNKNINKKNRHKHEHTEFKENNKSDTENKKRK